MVKIFIRKPKSKGEILPPCFHSGRAGVLGWARLAAGRERERRYDNSHLIWKRMDKSIDELTADKDE